MKKIKIRREKFDFYALEFISNSLLFNFVTSYQNHGQNRFKECNHRPKDYFCIFVQMIKQPKENHDNNQFSILILREKIAYFAINHKIKTNITSSLLRFDAVLGQTMRN